MSLYRAHKDKSLTLPMKILGWPLVIIGALVDVIANVTIASLIFWQIPRQFFVTQRLKEYKSIGSGWRYNIATWICSSLLDAVDPNHDHCR